MNMDYSKAFELLNQDAENERNKKAEKAVHDNLYNKGFRDGLAVLNKIRAEIVERRHLYQINEVSIEHSSANGTQALTWVLEIIDKYTTESEE